MDKISTTATIAQLSNAYVTYGVSVAGSLIYIGSTALHRILELGELGRNPLFRATVTRDTPLTITEYARHPTKAEAYADLQERLKQQTPPCNTPQPAPTQNRGKRVQRADGLIYDNASQAAKANNITPSAMSNHLTRRAGYETVRGLSFDRLED